jgi:hypothetical protein
MLDALVRLFIAVVCMVCIVLFLIWIAVEVFRACG